MTGVTPLGYRRPSFAQSTAWNALAVFIQTAAVQAAVLPLLGRALALQAFGRLLTAIAIATVVGMVCGSASSNLAMRDYARQHDQPGYRSSWARLNTCFLLLMAGGVAAVLLVSLSVAIDDVGLLTLLAVAIGARTYLAADLRLQLAYRQIAFSNGAAILGYAFGLLVLWSISDTPPLAVLVAGELLAVIYLARHSAATLAGFAGLAALNDSLRASMGFAASAVATNLQSYADRFVLAYAISDSAVALFFVASLGGRLAQTVASVVANVSLSYLSNSTVDRIRHLVKPTVMAAVVAALVTWAAVVVVFPFLLSWLYPQAIEDARPLLGLVTAGFAISILEMGFRPLTIRAVSIKALTTLEVATAATYCLAGLLAARNWGLQGFAIAFISVQAIKISIQTVLLFRVMSSPP